MQEHLPDNPFADEAQAATEAVVQEAIGAKVDQEEATAASRAVTDKVGYVLSPVRTELTLSQVAMASSQATVTGVASSKAAVADGKRRRPPQFRTTWGTFPHAAHTSTIRMTKMLLLQQREKACMRGSDIHRRRGKAFLISYDTLTM